MVRLFQIGNVWCFWQMIACIPEFWSAREGAYYIWACIAHSLYLKRRTISTQNGYGIIKPHPREACYQGKISFTWWGLITISRCACGYFFVLKFLILDKLHLHKNVLGWSPFHVIKSNIRLMSFACWYFYSWNASMNHTDIEEGVSLIHSNHASSSDILLAFHNFSTSCVNVNFILVGCSITKDPSFCK